MNVYPSASSTLGDPLRTTSHLQGFGAHTFRFVKAQGSTFVKLHWKPKQGVQSTLWDEAVELAGADPDFHRRDLFEAIHRGDFPEWEFGIQLFDEAFAAKLPYDVLDATKIIPEEILPVRTVGRMVLVGGALMSDGSRLKVDAQLAGFPLVMTDAIALALSAEGCRILLQEASLGALTTLKRAGEHRQRQSEWFPSASGRIDHDY